MVLNPDFTGVILKSGSSVHPIHQVKSCSDRKDGYKGFTRKCSGVPLRKCHQVWQKSGRWIQKPVLMSGGGGGEVRPGGGHRV